MRAPAPVEHVSSLGRAWRAALAAIVAVSVAVPLAWGLPYVAAHWGSRQPGAFFTALADPWVQGGIALWLGLIVFAATWLARQSRRASERTLRWDGQEWILAAANGGQEQRGDASLMLDLGPWMLVRFLPCATRAGVGGGTWLPFHMASDVARWAALRGALWNWRSDAGARARGGDSTRPRP